ncbi:NAD(P)-dependent alcohol dehydrogenase [Streptomyces violaceusniger]|uniref:Alcohol dehydrogenase zinc-binding domain protein n=1 Tax=Streptomyces violaceusniger (strain Tu 4113) TaxID=653045 RepID=G2P0H8_STRV4|nr:NAD(P)-dependent alcohol dehydrogenase [Streptomyces violaceusniger]AEM85976.1 Alcohol dehydrogenase zinc-binding domain protein [Streptomyces violaceusniger Tu 4113]
MNITAAVLDRVGSPFVLKEVEIVDPGRDEVLVELHGSGLCHTDVAVQHGHTPFPLPGVLGHEGSGIVRSVGAGVSGLAVGDHVCLSFDSCGECGNCRDGVPSYCDTFIARNFVGSRLDGSGTLSLDGEPLGSNFLGQSSFASHAVAGARSVVKIPTEVPLALAAPLGCGIQTGAGAVLRSLNVQPGGSVLILGAGSVGLSAVMAAVLAGAQTIVVAEPLESRRLAAKDLGATHGLDPVAGKLHEQIREIVPRGVRYAVDTTAKPAVLGEVVQAMAKRGAIALLGVPSDPTAVLPLSLGLSQILGLTVAGSVEGDSDPHTFIPWLLDRYLQGRFPIDRMVTTVPFADINEAVLTQTRGDAVKVVLTHQ